MNYCWFENSFPSHRLVAVLSLKNPTCPKYRAVFPLEKVSLVLLSMLKVGLNLPMIFNNYYKKNSCLARRRGQKCSIIILPALKIFLKWPTFKFFNLFKRWLNRINSKFLRVHWCVIWTYESNSGFLNFVKYLPNVQISTESLPSASSIITFASAVSLSNLNRNYV